MTRPNLNKVILSVCIILIISISYRDQIYHLLMSHTTQTRLVIYDVISDDAFYYLKIAEHILNDSTSTFDGFTLTNGYQPLWMLILLGVGVFLKVDTIGYAILMLAIVILILLTGTYYFHRLRKELLGGDSNYTAAILYFFSTLFISRNGMEVCLLFLLIPLFFLQLYKLEKKTDNLSYFWLGLLISILILSRLDAVLFVFLTLVLFVLVKWRQHTRLPSLKNIGSIFIGLIPFIAYMIYNLVIFGNLIPISGRAKSLHIDGLMISQTGLNSLYDSLTHEPYLLLFSLFTLAALIITAFYFIRKTSFKNMVFFSTMIYPVLFFTYYLVTSDWPFWLWYYYPLAISFSFAYVFFEELIVFRYPNTMRIYKYSLIGIFLMLVVLFGLKWRSVRSQFIPNSILEAAIQIEGFSNNHPGIYAMGDRAGAVSFLMINPLIQSEGLVADNGMLNSIKAQKNLMDVFHKYSVNYYIATDPEFSDGCWIVQEPRIPGKNAPRMRAILCQPPVFTFTATLDDVTTMVFQIEK